MVFQDSRWSFCLLRMSHTIFPVFGPPTSLLSTPFPIRAFKDQSQGKYQLANQRNFSDWTEFRSSWFFFWTLYKNVRILKLLRGYKLAIDSKEFTELIKTRGLMTFRANRLVLRLVRTEPFIVEEKDIRAIVLVEEEATESPASFGTKYIYIEIYTDIFSYCS